MLTLVCMPHTFMNTSILGNNDFANFYKKEVCENNLTLEHFLTSESKYPGTCEVLWFREPKKDFFNFKERRFKIKKNKTSRAL